MDIVGFFWVLAPYLNILVVIVKCVYKKKYTEQSKSKKIQKCHNISKKA